jgi:hypothetical protein
MSGCSCVWVDGYGENSIQDTDKRTARKPHKCCECDRQIDKGETYYYDTVLYDREWDHYKTCADCYSVRNAFFCDGWPYGDVWMALTEHLRDMRGEIPESKCMMSLTTKAREKVCEIIEKIWSRLDG